MDTALADQIDGFLTTAGRVRTAKPGSARRQAIQRILCKQATDLRRVRDELMSKLGEGDDWLSGRNDHTLFPEFEQQWIDEWLAGYVAVCDALEQALDVWLTEGDAA